MKKLIISGSNYETCADRSKTSIINEDQLDVIMPIIRAIKEHKGSYNWAIGTDLERNRTTGGWDSVPKWQKKYRQFSDKFLKSFGKYVPDGIDNITSIKFLEYEVVNEVVFL